MSCPCGSFRDYDKCCRAYHQGVEIAPTAEALMRSRYTAFVKRDIAYLKESTWPPLRPDFDEAGYADRAAKSLWLGLNILETDGGTPDQARGTVTFTARSMINGEMVEQTEKSLFRKKNSRWYYVKPIE